MEIDKKDVPPPPPGVIHALTTGFNAVASHVWVILFPMALDVFLWLGPRLKVDELTRPLVEELVNAQASQPAGLMDVESMKMMLDGLNLFSVLRTFPIGVFSLMSVNLSGDTPWGARADIQVGNAFILFIGAILLSIIGWLAGSIFYHFVARAAVPGENQPPIWRALLHGVLLSGVVNAAASVISIPVFFMMGILVLINATMGIIAYFVLMILMLWLALPLFFSAHGIFADSRNAFSSLWQGFRLVRFGLPSMGWFAIVALMLNQGMDLLWRVAPANSWMTLVGIFGHAFVSTSLLAASFIYYRQLSEWVDSALQWLKSQKPSSARA